MAGSIKLGKVYMKRAAGTFFSLALITGAIAIAIAKQYTGATFQDIMSAMGTDALGLEISADKLPDIATLKESRFDDQADKFIVEHPYTGGRWKGGHARVEYARDLSYAIISVYDKQGKRQRIYSVKARPSEESDDLVAAVNAAGHTSPAEEPVSPPEPPQTPPQSPPAPSAAQASQPQTQAPTPTPTPAPAKKKHHHRSGVAVEQSVAGTTPGSDVWVPVAQPSETDNSAQAVVKAQKSAPASSASSSEAVPQSPVAGFVWDENLGAYVPASGGGSSQPAVQETVPVIAAAPANSASSVTPTPPAKVVAVDVPSTDELLGTSGSNTTSPAASPSPVKSTPAKSAPAVPASPPEVPQNDQALIAKAKKDLQAAEQESPSSSNDNGTGPDTSESDQWVPKPVKVAAAPEPVVPQPVQVAMIPKAAPPDASIDNLLKISGQNPAAAAADSDAWVPKNTKLPKADADVIAQLNQIKAQKPAPAPVVKINRDINNPEAGVLPVNSFEKFVGPRYGRHREYERRLMFGKKPNSKVKDYDFYVDEVDRKKEIHNVYYYKKGKVPKLVAVEKHYSVTFLSNYDVDKEDKGKISIE